MERSIMLVVKRLLTVSAAVILLTATGSARAEDRYYMMIFASQSAPNVVRHSHTFAVFAKAFGRGQFPDDYQIEAHTISWMPASGRIWPLRPGPVPGVNMSLADTFKWAEAEGKHISMWGPFPVSPRLYDMAVSQETKLNQGKLQYQCIDTRYRAERAVNCIHAVSDLDLTQSRLNTGTSHGKDASKLVLTHFEPYIQESRESNRWLVDRLHLDPDIVHFENPELIGPAHNPAVYRTPGKDR
jgi:hypothetical protein